MQPLIISVAVVLVLVTGMLCRQILHRNGAVAAAGVALLRLSAVGLFAYLAWLALMDYDDAQSSPSRDGQPRKLLVLQDKSHSMSFPTANSTRDQLATSAWSEIQSRTAENPNLEVSRLLFASNFVEEQREHLLRKDATRLGHTLSEILNRYRADAVIIVSDGASTDGSPPSYLLDWIENRGIGMFAVATGSTRQTMCDIHVMTADCALENPDILRVEVNGLGTVPDRTLVRLTIDGQRVASRRVMVKGKTSFSFTIPPVEDGWHEFSVEAISSENEICQINNRRMGVFRKEAPRKVLFLYSSPQMEYRHLTRFLRDIYPGRLQVTSVFSDQAKELVSDDYVFCILGNVSPAMLNDSMKEALDSQLIPTLFLSGDHLMRWSQRHDSFPVTADTRHRNMVSDFGRTGRVVRASGLSSNRWRFSDFDMLPVYDMVDASVRKQAVRLLDTVVGTQRFPLLVTDSLDTPRQFVMLTSSSWRWGLSPDADVRSSFRALWRRIANMAVAERIDETPLTVSIEPIEPGDSMMTVAVGLQDNSRSAELTNVAVSVRVGPTTVDYTPAQKNNIWQVDCPISPDRPVVMWVSATATLNGQELTSLPKPLVFNPDGLEFSDTLPHPERLRALVREPELDVASATDARPVIDRALDHLKQAPRTYHVRQRDQVKELTIALIILLILSVDWYYQRRLKETPGS